MRALSSVVLVCGSAAPLRAIAQVVGDGSDADPETPLSTFGRAEWIRIPRIGVDAHVSEVGISDGYYEVPWFDVGHHFDSHAPGDDGNSIFNGHVTTINAGEVFHRLHELTAGDAVYVYTAGYRLDWAVQDVFSVAWEDNSFLVDTDEPRLTLYTCTGRFNPIERSFAERLVAIGELVDSNPRG